MLLVSGLWIISRLEDGTIQRLCYGWIVQGWIQGKVKRFFFFSKASRLALPCNGPR